MKKPERFQAAWEFKDEMSERKWRKILPRRCTLCHVDAIEFNGMKQKIIEISNIAVFVDELRVYGQNNGSRSIQVYREEIIRRLICFNWFIIES